MNTMVLVIAGICAGSPAPAQHGAPPEPSDWRASEAPALTGHVQLTSRGQFLRAGEAYFSPDARWIIFQAIPVPEAGREPANIYSMYVARLKRDDAGMVTGLDEPIRVSADGSANTCGYFHPRERGWIIFGSTLVAPTGPAAAGYQRGSSTYAWKFPREMEVVARLVPAILYDARPKLTEEVDWREGDLDPTPIWTRDGYDAECAYSADGRHIVYTRVDPETNDPDLWVYDSRSGIHRPLVVAPGYDGGPFFSPDGAMICYRSDRKGDDLLQVFIAELAYSDDGAVLGVKREAAVTGNEHVNWAPFWHPSGEYLVYTTSEQGHHNYEVYATQIPVGLLADVRPADLRRKRITHAAGFDGLPAFSPAGDLLMWTSQRGGKLPEEERASSQLWIAKCHDLSP